MKHLAHTLQLNPGFDDLEKGTQERIAGGELFIPVVVAGGDKLIGEVVILINDNVKRREIIVVNFFDNNL